MKLLAAGWTVRFDYAVVLNFSLSCNLLSLSLSLTHTHTQSDAHLVFYLPSPLYTFIAGCIDTEELGPFSPTFIANILFSFL
jgi:hypothetical protein